MPRYGRSALCWRQAPYTPAAAPAHTCAPGPPPTTSRSPGRGGFSASAATRRSLQVQASRASPTSPLPPHDGSVEDPFDAAARAIGEPGLTPHELRHTVASLAIEAGANVGAVQRMLEHASAATTPDRYADLFDDLDDVADRLDALRAASRGRVADLLRNQTPSEGSPEPATEVDPQVGEVETRGIEPLTPALQRRCSAN